MPNYNEPSDVSAAIETEARRASDEKIKRKSALDYFSLAVATCGVGYLPLAPGTWGSMVGIVIYLLFRTAEMKGGIYFLQKSWNAEQIAASVYAINSIAFLLFCFWGIWASNRAVKLFQKKDPQKVVVDEVIGQLIVFLFVPLDLRWYFVLTGFLLFRLFDIWKPYPIKSLESLPAGIGVCADDILAGVYGGVCLALLYAAQISL